MERILLSPAWDKKKKQTLTLSSQGCIFLALHLNNVRQNLWKLEEQRNSGRSSHAHQIRGSTKTCCCEGRGHKLWNAASLLFLSLSAAIHLSYVSLIDSDHSSQRRRSSHRLTSGRNWKTLCRFQLSFLLSSLPPLCPFCSTFWIKGCTLGATEPAWCVMFRLSRTQTETGKPKTGCELCGTDSLSAIQIWFWPDCFINSDQQRHHSSQNSPFMTLDLPIKSSRNMATTEKHNTQHGRGQTRGNDGGLGTVFKNKTSCGGSTDMFVFI